MLMRQPFRSCLFLLIALVLFALPASRAAAHDEGGGGITLRAPLDAVDCTATPPTITVLGLTIDISTATIDAHGEGDDGGEQDFVAHAGLGQDGGGDGEDDQGDDDQGDGDHAGACAALVAGQCVRVTFASDAVPLVATKVKQCDGGEDDAGVEIKAPLQAVDSSALTVTLLGLTVDVSTATLRGNDGEGDSLPIDLGQAMPGELAEVHLDPTKLPALVATLVEVQIDSLVVIQAPLDAVDCAATPPTVTVLGLTIDVSTATIHAGGDDGEDDGEDGEDSDGGCAGLVPGKLVRVVLASDTTPLVAILVKQHDGEDDGEDGGTVEIKAPLQADDSTAQTVTLLGLTIDVSTAGLDGGTPPIDFTKLVVGQVAEVHLDASKLPALVATNLQVTNVGSDVDVEVDDPSGTEVDDPDDDVDIDVTETVVTKHAGTTKHTKTTLHFHTTGHGSFHLSGLPAGGAKIKVTRVQGGVTMGRSQGVRLKSNKAQTLRLKLKRMRTHA